MPVIPLFPLWSQISVSLITVLLANIWSDENGLLTPRQDFLRKRQIFAFISNGEVFPPLQRIGQNGVRRRRGRRRKRKGRRMLTTHPQVVFLPCCFLGCLSFYF